MRTIICILLFCIYTNANANGGTLVSARNHNDVNGCTRWILTYNSNKNTVAGMIMDAKNDTVVRSYISTGQVIQLNLYGKPDKDNFYTFISTINLTDENGSCTAIDGPYSGYGWILEKR